MTADLAVTAKVSYGTPRRAGSLVHRIESVTGFWDGQRIRYRAKWECAGNSLDAILIAGPADHAVCLDCTAPREPVVYRCFGSDGQLLYVGHTNCHPVRMRKHEYTAQWWPEVADIQIERFPSLAEAREAEERAIASERPRYNTLLTGTRTRARRFQGRGARVPVDGRAILRLIRLAGLSQRELAERLGCSQAYISRLIKGQTEVSPHYLPDLAAILGCTIADIDPHQADSSAA